MSIDRVGEQSIYWDLLAVCGFSFIGFLISARVLFEFAPVDGIVVP